MRILITSFMFITLTIFYLKQNDRFKVKKEIKVEEINDSTNYSLYNKKIKEALTYYRQDKDYIKSIKTFKKAFLMVKTPFGLDIMDALNASIIIESKEDMFYFAKIFIENGCKASFFERKDLQVLKDYPKEFENLINYVDYVQVNSEQYWNVELREKLTFLYREDQRLAKKYKYTDSLKMQYKNWVLCTEYDTIVKRPFLKLIEEYGIIGPTETGIILQKDEQSFASAPEIIILHILQRGENRFTQQELENCVKRGIASEFTVEGLIDTAKHNKRLYPKVQTMIERGTDEDSISMQITKEWRLF